MLFRAPRSRNFLYGIARIADESQREISREVLEKVSIFALGLTAKLLPKV
jgi:hypothetical protein